MNKQVFNFSTVRVDQKQITSKKPEQKTEQKYVPPHLKPTKPNSVNQFELLRNCDKEPKTDFPSLSNKKTEFPSLTNTKKITQKVSTVWKNPNKSIYTLPVVEEEIKTEQTLVQIEKKSINLPATIIPIPIRRHNQYEQEIDLNDELEEEFVDSEIL